MTNSFAMLATAALLGAAVQGATLSPSPVRLPDALLPGPLAADSLLADPLAREATSAQVERELEPLMTECVRSDVADHFAPADLNELLTKAADDPRMFLQLRQAMNAALARCWRDEVEP